MTLWNALRRLIAVLDAPPAMRPALARLPRLPSRRPLRRRTFTG